MSIQSDCRVAGSYKPAFAHQEDTKTRERLGNRIWSSAKETFSKIVHAFHCPIPFSSTKVVKQISTPPVVSESNPIRTPALECSVDQIRNVAACRFDKRVLSCLFEKDIPGVKPVDTSQAVKAFDRAEAIKALYQRTDIIPFMPYDIALTQIYFYEAEGLKIAKEAEEKWIAEANGKLQILQLTAPKNNSAWSLYFACKAEAAAANYESSLRAFADVTIAYGKGRRYVIAPEPLIDIRIEFYKQQKTYYEKLVVLQDNEFARVAYPAFADLDISILTSKARQYADERCGGEFSEQIFAYITGVLTDPSFKRDPTAYMWDWKIKRGNTEIFKIVEDSSRSFLELELPRCLKASA